MVKSFTARLDLGEEEKPGPERGHAASLQSQARSSLLGLMIMTGGLSAVPR